MLRRTPRSRFPPVTRRLELPLDAQGEIPFGWDNEFDAHTVEVAAFDLDVHSVTNADYLPFVEAGHVEPPAFW